MRTKITRKSRIISLPPLGVNQSPRYEDYQSKSLNFYAKSDCCGGESGKCCYTDKVYNFLSKDDN